MHSSQPSQGVEALPEGVAVALHRCTARKVGVCEMCASRISHKSQSSSLCHRIHGSQGDAWLRRRADAAARAGWERAAKFNAD